MHATYSFASPSHTRRPGIVVGIVVSLALHLLLIFGYRLSGPPPEAPRAPAPTITVWLQPARPPQPVAKLEPPPPPPQPERRKREQPAAPRQPAPAAPAPVIVATPPPAPSQAITQPQPDPLHPELQPKKFDMDAALKTARQIASEKDPGRADTAVAQLKDHPLYPEDRETQLQKGIASAKKYDCLKSGAGMGLLAPLAWAFDKHCKF